MAKHLLLHICILLTTNSILGFSPLIASVTKSKNNDALKQDVEHVVREKLQRVTAGYENHMDCTMRTMDMEIELSEKTEKCLLRGASTNHMLLSEKTRRKQLIMEECLHANNKIVQRLLLGWDGEVTKGCQLFQSIEYIKTSKDDESLLGKGGVTDAQLKETEGYDTAQQVITHTARDWTASSSACRDATNGWIVQAIIKHCNEVDKLRVLVPGSGLGRLAYDISTCDAFLSSGTDVFVEANDSSITMAFAAKSVLELVQHQAVSKVYPFVSDPQRNEIYSARRFESAVFPDDGALAAYRHYNAIKIPSPNLSYTIGDFASTYSYESRRGLYNVVATSFFIDTATNIYEYIYIMKHVLQKDNTSIWVNCGPVQWHPCAMLRPTVDELKDILQACGFELVTWEIAEEAVAYRHPDDYAPLDARYTREEGYRPLRFVARLSKFDAVDDLHDRIEYITYLNEVANGKVKE